MTGEGIERSPIEALTLLSIACGHGHQESCSRVGRKAMAHPSRSSTFEAPKKLEQTCESGFFADCVLVGKIYDDGGGVLIPIPGSGAPFFRRACEGGEWAGCYELALLYEQGEGMERDEAEAKRLFERACAGGYTAACR